ncbi:MAG: hypothetical protein A2076_11575 [Geobacteraceae bacterium GWC2_53_11]|nr:MAG: hypothetical protein A2076_11575 [Geobacteraceae bacterium GWC2_53_11]
MRHSDEDGSDIFWPGYVDAVTNLVLNLLFLLTIMTVAVFMFALELGRASKGGATQKTEASNVKVTSPPSADPVKENAELKREIQRLNMQLAQRVPQKVQPGVVEKTVDIASALPQPQKRLDKTLGASDTDVVVRFADEAVTFTPAEQGRLRETLKPIVAHGKTSIVVEVPAGFSEAKRMGYYRAMEVRNLLIDMKMPKENINVLVREGKSNANAALVRVKAR